MRALKRFCIVLAILTVALVVAFAIQSWQTKRSDFVTRAEQSAIAYDCIGGRMLAQPVQQHPAANLARWYMFDQLQSGPEKGEESPIRRRLAEISAAITFDLLYSDAELNRMRATLQLGPFSSFDDMSQRLFASHYCSLTAERRLLISQFERSSSYTRFRKLLLEAGENDAASTLQSLLPPSPKL